MGAVLWYPLREAANHLGRCIPRKADDRGLVRLCTESDKQTNKPLYIITGATDAMGSVVTQNLAEAGFHTAFFSNQQRNHSYIDFLGEEANDVCFIREHLANKFTYDSQLLPYVRRELAKHPKKLFMVLHMYGSHFNYRDRYPKADARFLPDLPTEAKAKNRRQLLNAYDNTVLVHSADFPSTFQSFAYTEHKNNEW